MQDKGMNGGFPGQLGGFIMVAVLGMGCLIAGAIGHPLMPAPLFPLLRTGVEHIGWIALVGLGVLGLAAGSLTRLPVLGIGLSSMAIPPIVAIAEIVADPTSHNLIPFELVMYLLMCAPALLMALLGRTVRSRLRPSAPGHAGG